MTAYTIKDKANRTWGNFSVEFKKFGMVYGYLTPTTEFEDVFPVFIKHDEDMTSAKASEALIDDIVDLGAYLIDNSSGKTIDIGNVIFINKEYLVTCSEWD